MKFSFSLLLLFLTMQLFGQENTIKGVLLSSENDFVPFAQVILYKKDTSFYKATLTDSLGKYVFPKIPSDSYLIGIKKADLILVSVVGNENIVMAQPIFIKAKEIILNDVKIIGKKNYFFRDLDKLIISVEDMLITKGKTVIELLPILPGLSLNPYGQISLNGRGTPLFMIDGKVIGTDGRQTDGLLRTLSAENVERIELISNPSSKYDSQGSGGVINIITKKQKSTSQIRTSLGTLLFPVTENMALDKNQITIGGNFNILLKKFKTSFIFDLNQNENLQETNKNRFLFSSLTQINSSRVQNSIGKSSFFRLGSSYDINKS